MMTMITADLVDPSDISMTESALGRSPHFTSAGVIGEPSPGLFSNFPNSRHKIPAPTNQAEMDLAALVAQAQRQHEAEKGRVIHNGAGNGDGMNGVNGEAHHRWGTDIWERAATKANGNGLRSALPQTTDDAPHSAPLPPFQPFSDSKQPHHAQSYSNPLMPIKTSPPGSDVPHDPAGQIAHHLQSLATLFNPLLQQSDEVQSLRKEVEMWKGEWGKVDKEKKRLENIVANPSSPKVMSSRGLLLLIISLPDQHSPPYSSMGMV